MMHSRSFFGLSGLLMPCIVLVMAFAVTGQEPEINFPDFPASPPMDQDVIYLQRGDVWHTSNRGVETKSVEMSRSNYAIDFPGFDPNFIKNIGSYTTHNRYAGVAFSALKEKGLTNPTLEQTLGASNTAWNMLIDPIATEAFYSPYHSHLWPNGENYYLEADPEEAQEVIVNLVFHNPGVPEESYNTTRWSPFDLARIMRAWHGNKEDARYIINERFVMNSGDATAFDTYVNLAWAPRINDRSMNRMGFGGDAQDDHFFFDADRNMVWMRDHDYLDAVSPAEDIFDYRAQEGPPDPVTGDATGEWMAPGHLGFQLLYGTETSTGKKSTFFKWGVGKRGFWGVGFPWGYGSGQKNLNEKWRIMAGLDDMPREITVPDDLGSQELVYLVQFMGPWDLAPGEFVRFVSAEIIGSVDWEVTTNPTTTANDIAQGEQILMDLADKTKFIWSQVQKGNGWNMPDAPPAPKEIRMAPYTEGGQAGNTIIWDAGIESIDDPDYGSNDIASYKVWKNQYSPLGPWNLLATVTKGSMMKGSAYHFNDTDVRVGQFYYYAVSTVDTGHPSWPIDENGWTAYNGSAAVPVLESVRTPYLVSGQPVAYKTNRAPGNSLADVRVYPNPYVKSSGFDTQTEADQIFFANIPLDATVKIYTVRGDLIRSYHHISNDAEWGWDMLTTSGQWAESGVYIFTITSHWSDSKGQMLMDKFMIMR